MSVRRRALGTTALLLATACGGSVAYGPFSMGRPDARGAELQRAAELARPAGPVEPLVLTVEDGGGALTAHEVPSGRRRWRVEARLGSVPWLAGRYVVHAEGEAVVLRSAADGREVARQPREQLQLVGASGDGPWAVVVLSTGGGVGARSAVLAFREGRLRHRWAFEQVAGVPLVRGPVAFVPWASQFVSALHLPDGREIARARLGDAQLTQAWAEPGGPFVGGQVAVPWDAALASGDLAGAGGFRVALGELPGNPPARADDPTRPPLPPTSAAHRVGLRWWAAREGGRAVLGNGVVFFVFYRAVLALEPGGGEEAPRVRWARRLEQDVVAAEAGPRTLWVLLRDGRLLALCAGQGRLAEVGRLQEAGRIAYGRLPRGALPRPDFDETRPPLAAQLARLASARDARTTPVQRFAVRRLAALQGPEVTEALIGLCEARRVPPAVRADACAALGERSDGAEAVVATLRGRASFLEDRPAPPLGALARAAARSEARGAVPLLLRHLDDPATPAEALAAIAEALGTLGGEGVADGLEAFARFYRAEPGPAPLAEGVSAALRALLRLDEERGRAVIEELLGAPDTAEAVREAVGSWWEAWLAERAAAEAPEEATGDEGSDAQGGGEEAGSEDDGEAPGGGGGREEAERGE